jgi:hypothetical protein
MSKYLSTGTRFNSLTQLNVAFTGGTFTYGNPSRNVYQNWRNEQWYFRLSGNGVSGSIKWRCPDEEAAREMKAFADSVYNEGYFNMEPAVCTDAPTSSPTKAPCKDSLLTEPPLNIAVVIDMSYSTYETVSTCRWILIDVSFLAILSSDSSLLSFHF